MRVLIKSAEYDNESLFGGNMKNLVIVGAGEFGRELYWTITGSKGFNSDFVIKGYIDDDNNSEKISLLSAPFLGMIDTYRIAEDDVFTCAVANPASREIVIKRCLEKGAVFIDIIHNSSIIHGTVKMGRGCIISPYSIIGDGSNIGNYVVVNGLSCIGHDCEIGDYVCIMSHCDITGHSSIGKNAFIAGGVRTVPKAKIGADAYVGAGSVVLKKVKPGTKVFGNPAREF